MQEGLTEQNVSTTESGVGNFGCSAELSKTHVAVEHNDRREAERTGIGGIRQSIKPTLPSEGERMASSPQTLSPYEIYKDPDEYENFLQQKATEAGIKLSRRPSLWYALNGAGIAVTVGESGRKYIGEPIFEPIAEIYYQGWSPLVKVHEMTHVEQRLINPERQETSLPQIEIEASERALKAGGWKCLLYPISSFNQIINLARYRFLNFLERKLPQAV